MVATQMVDVLVPHGATTWGTKAHAAVRVDFTEHERRAQHGLGALDRAAVNAMFNLPYGYWIRWDDLDSRCASFLEALPGGVVELSDFGVRRLVTPLVTVKLAVVTGLPWTAGLRATCSFAPFCSRVLLLDQRRRIPKAKLWEASYWGIGVWALTTDGVEELVPPAPWQQRYWKPAGWEFRERAYDAWLRSTGDRPLGGPPDLFGPGGLRGLSA